MSATAATLSVDNPKPVRGLLLGGLLCGILDISSAIIITLLRHGSPFRMLQGIASRHGVSIRGATGQGWLDK